MELWGESSRRRGWQRNPVKEKLEEMVLKWSFQDIMNEDLFQDKVKDIPETFMSLEEYLGSFVWPVIEEIRAHLQQSLECVSQAQYADIIFQGNIQPSGGAVETYLLLIDRESDTGGEKKGQEDFKLKPMDILILSTKLPENLDAFHDDYLLALVSRMDGQGTSSSDCQDTSRVGLEVKLYVRDRHPFTSKSYNIKNKYFAIYLSSIVSSLRIWKALHPDWEDGENNLAMLRKAICLNSEGHNEVFAEEKEDGSEKFRSKHFMSHNLNDSQASAVIRAINAVESNVFPNINLIQAPPRDWKDLGADFTSFYLSP